MDFLVVLVSKLAEKVTFCGSTSNIFHEFSYNSFFVAIFGSELRRNMACIRIIQELKFSVGIMYRLCEVVAVAPICTTTQIGHTVAQGGVGRRGGLPKITRVILLFL